MTRPVDAAWGPCDVAPSVDGTCVLCGTEGTGMPVYGVLSDNFLNGDRLPFRATPTPMLCPACSWSFRDRRLRQQATETTAEGLRVLDPPALLDALSRPVDGDRAVCVPIQGRKHLYPWLRWGTVMSDQGDRAWGEQEVERLRTVAWLRDLGFGEAALREPSPRWTVLGRLGPQHVSDALDAWPSLRPWRLDQTIEVAIRATRKAKEREYVDCG